MQNIFTEFLQRENMPGLMNYPLGHDLPTLSINSNQLIKVEYLTCQNGGAHAPHARARHTHLNK